jgi:hypothetical protein
MLKVVEYKRRERIIKKMAQTGYFQITGGKLYRPNNDGEVKFWESIARAMLNEAER